MKFKIKMNWHKSITVEADRIVITAAGWLNFYDNKNHLIKGIKGWQSFKSIK